MITKIENNNKNLHEHQKLLNIQTFKINLFDYVLSYLFAYPKSL